MTSILDKVRLLRALSTSSNVNEAAAAAAAADKLIAEHRLSEEEINLSDPSRKQIPQKDENVLYETSRITMWKYRLCGILARNYGCASYNDLSRNDKGRQLTRIRLFGQQSDLEIVQYMYVWLTAEIERLTKINCKGMGHVFCHQYAEGAVDGISAQLTLQAEANKRSANEAGQSAALVRLDSRALEAKNAMYNGVSGLRTTKIVSHANSNGFARDQGRAAGMNIQLNKGLGGANTKQLT